MTYDSVKRARTLEERGLDFDDAAVVFAGVTLEVEDTRMSYCNYDNLRVKGGCSVRLNV